MKIFFALFFTLILLSNLFADRGNDFKKISEKDFFNPPNSVGPTAYWFWMGYNITESGITKDLEAMKRMGMAGASIFNIMESGGRYAKSFNNSYVPGLSYQNAEWWKLVRYAANEAKRLGLSIGMHNCPGSSASGGPWITPAQSMQKVVWTEKKVTGPAILDEMLAHPLSVLDYYEEIAVLAVPITASGYPGINLVEDISSKMAADGRVQWKVPPGIYIIYRFGHTCTGKETHPIPEDLIQSLEADKMSVEAMGFHVQHIVDALQKNLGALVGNGFNHIMFDSYEAGAQNWTSKMRESFFKSKGYDIIPWLPVLAERTIGSVEMSSRFQSDLKSFISDMIIGSAYALPRKMLNEAGLMMYAEPYRYGKEEPFFDHNDGAAATEVPMTEFWTHSKGPDGRIGAAAAPMGVNIYGAEAFTGSGSEKMTRWEETPAMFKYTGDVAFANGINRLTLHHWTLQPFPDNVKPGMSMGFWGAHFGRNQTWAVSGKAWMDYLSRCQYLLQKGSYVADFIAVGDYIPGGDVISENIFLTKLSVENGKIVMESGRKYALLILPNRKTMSLAFAEKTKSIVEKGAIIMGPRPDSSVENNNYQIASKEVEKIGEEVWGNADSISIKEHSFGKGKVLWGYSTEEALKIAGVRQDVKLIGKNTKPILWTHRESEGSDIYYFTNLQGTSATFNAQLRVKGKQPELWNPETGEVEMAGFWQPTITGCELRLNLSGWQAVFVVFKKIPEEIEFAQNIITSVDDTLYQVKRLNNEFFIQTSKVGKFDLQISNGKKLSAIVSSIPAGINISGPWKVDFKSPLGQIFTTTFDKLQSWTLSADERVKYFSGTATYRNSFDLPAKLFSKAVAIKLDLGNVKELAEITINEQPVAAQWHAPFVVNVSKYLKAGKNSIAVSVTNTWANRMIGDEQFPEDCEWWGLSSLVPWALNGQKTNGIIPNIGGPLASLPGWLIKGEERKSGRTTFSTWDYFNQESVLLPAGLLSPLKLKVEIIERFK